MSAQNDGGPAFPCQSFEYDAGIRVPVFEHGMTLRDWFAGQALAGIAGMAMCVRSDDWPDDRCSAYAYELADAMLAAREAKQ